MKSYYIVNGIELVNNDKDNTVCYRSENEKGEKRTTVLFFSTDNQDRVNYIENIRDKFKVVAKLIITTKTDRRCYEHNKPVFKTEDPRFRYHCYECGKDLLEIDTLKATTPTQQELDDVIIDVVYRIDSSGIVW